MWSKNAKLLHNNLSCIHLSRKLFLDHLEINEEVRSALNSNKPIVALESTIITHGMPFPQNEQCTQEVEAIVRNLGAIPATIALLGGKIKVGLSAAELRTLAYTNSSSPVKTSRRDFPFVIANKLNGGTTVAGTLIVAKYVKIPVFATGGIGGVHREVESTLDISADLIELGRSPVAVVSSGVKSILDIPKTLEFLETQGVLVATLGNSKEFPAFYTRKSGCTSPYNVRTAQDAARLIKSHLDLQFESGLLFAVPVPEEFALNDEEINSFISQALEDARDKGIRGKQITPYLLEKIADLTGGSSLRTNVALIKNNARVAAEIATNLAQLRSNRSSNGKHYSSNYIEEETNNLKPVVIGGSVLDCCATIKESEICFDGRIHEAKFRISPGGVGRNIAEALCKLGCTPNFISAVGDDNHGQFLRSLLPAKCSRGVKVVANSATCECILVFDSEGECVFLMGDMEIHKEITPHMIEENENLIKNAPLLVFDGNLPMETMERALEIAATHNVPVFFEPTDVPISVKPFQTQFWKSIKYITPNLNELKQIATVFQIPNSNNSASTKVEEAFHVVQHLVQFIPNILVTLGADGLLVARRGDGNSKSALYCKSNAPIQTKTSSIRHYAANNACNVVNVSGAGDCLASGIIAAMLQNQNEEQCISVGFAAAHAALHSENAVPIKLFDHTHFAWKSIAKHRVLNSFL